MIEIIQGIRMAESKLRFTSSRSACPGVRNVNKVSTRPTLLFDLAAFPSRAAGQKEKIRKRLASRTA